jgi:hypothetical protein
MKQFAVAIFCLLSIIASSQMSLAYTGRMGTFSAQRLLPTNGSGYISFKTVSANIKGKGWNTYRESVSFVRYDRDFKQVSEVKMTASGGICSREYYELKKVGNRFWFIYLEPMDNNEVGSIKALEVDPVSLQQKDAQTLLSSTTLDHTLRDYRYTIYFDFMCGVSPTGKYMYLNIQLSDDEGYLACFDENMKLLWGKKDRRGDDEMVSTELDDAGYLYMGKKSRKGNLYCSIWDLSGQMNSTNVSLAGGKVWDILFHPEKGKDLVAVTGTYKEDDNCTGVYKGVINKKGEITNISTIAFPKNIVESMDKEGFASTKAKKFGVHPAFCATAVRNSDGTSNIAMILEFRREAGGGATGPSTNLLGGSLVYVDFANGTPVFTRVPKYSVSSLPFHYAFNGHYGSGCMYFAMPVESKLVVLYFDNAENLTRDPKLDAKVVNPKNQLLVAAVINKDGTMKRQQVTISALGTDGVPPAPDDVVLFSIYTGAKDQIAAVRL